jgi:hypothetical protein
MAKKKKIVDDVVDFYDPFKKIIRPDSHSTMKYDFDIRKSGEKIWKYLNSSNNLSDFDEQVKVAIESGGKGEYRILISETQEVVRTNVK